MTTPNIEACPFCSHDAPFVQDEDLTSWVECGSCGARGPWVGPFGNCVEEWNTRAQATLQDKE